MSAHRPEIERVIELFLDGETRVGLVGVVGAGKTWLARAIADEWRARGNEVAWLDASLGALGDVLAVSLGASSADALSALRERGDVLVVVDGARGDESLRDWLARVGDTRVLCTSRDRLDVDRMQLVDVPALDASDARSLFEEHAKRRGHAVAPEDGPLVLEIVRLLDGLPLAIELAASRTAIMPVRLLLARLRAGFEVLGALGSALESALDALTPTERDALAQLSVFRGGFRLESAEAVVVVDAPALEVIASLRDKSIVSQEGERLHLLYVMRDRAASSADPASLAAAEERHAEHFGELCLRLAKGDRKGLLAERENVLAVAERMLSKKPVTARRAEPALRAMSALGDALLDVGTLDAFDALLEPTLVATQGSGAKPSLEASMVLIRGTLRLRRGDVPSATRDLLHALGVATTVGDRLLEARATLELGHALELRGDDPAALTHFERAAALFDAEGDTIDHGRALQAAGSSLMRTGRATEALATLERAIAACEASPDDACAASIAWARAALDCGDARGARSRVEQARASQLSRRLRARASWVEGLLALERADADAASIALRSASSDLRALGAVREALRVELALSLALRERGQDGEAYVLAKGALSGLRDVDRDGAAIACAHLAVLELEAGRADLARTLLGSVGTTRSPEAKDVLAAAQVRLDPTWPAPPPTTVQGRAARRVWQSISPSKRPPPPDDALLIGANASWFRAPHGERVNLDRRRNLALLLAHLASAARSSVTSSELVAAGWPGEKVIATAGAHRVRVAIATLRKLGLKDAIVTTADGYTLASNITVVRVD